MENSIELKIDGIKDLLIPAEKIIAAIRDGRLSPGTTLTFSFNDRDELCYDLKTSSLGKINGITSVLNLLEVNP